MVTWSRGIEEAEAEGGTPHGVKNSSAELTGESGGHGQWHRSRTDRCLPITRQFAYVGHLKIYKLESSE